MQLRLVAGGHRQKCGADHSFVYASASRHTTSICVLLLHIKLGKCTPLSFPMPSMYGTLGEQVYMQFEHLSDLDKGSGRVYMLRKTLC